MSEKFVSILIDVYYLNYIKLSQPSNLLLEKCFCTSKLIWKKKLAFILPFNFFPTANLIDEKITEKDWENLGCNQISKNINFTISCIGKLNNIEKGVYIANNPILKLKKTTKPHDLFSKNHIQNIKKEINKAKKFNIIISFSENRNDLNKFYDVMAYQYVRNHKMIFQPKELFKRLLAAGMAKLLVAKQDDEVLGGLFCLLEQDVFHYNWSARKPFFNLNLGTLLLNHAISYAFSEGFSYFDFGSTPLSDKYLFNFKMKWGCDNYKVYKYFSKKQVPQKDLNKSFYVLRQIYSKIPINVAKQIMPIAVPFLVE